MLPSSDSAVRMGGECKWTIMSRTILNKVRKSISELSGRDLLVGCHSSRSECRRHYCQVCVLNDSCSHTGKLESSMSDSPSLTSVHPILLPLLRCMILICTHLLSFLGVEFNATENCKVTFDITTLQFWGTSYYYQQGAPYYGNVSEQGRNMESPAAGPKGMVGTEILRDPLALSCPKLLAQSSLPASPLTSLPRGNPKV